MECPFNSASIHSAPTKDKLVLGASSGVIGRHISQRDFGVAFPACSFGKLEGFDKVLIPSSSNVWEHREHRDHFRHVYLIFDVQLTDSEGSTLHRLC